MLKIIVRTLALCALLCGALIALPARPAYAFVGNTLYVTTTGTDSGNCQNPSTPCATIHYAITQTVSGDRIYLAGGTYHEHNIVLGSSLSILGAAMQSTIIDGDGVDRVFVTNPGTTDYIESLTIQDGVTGAAGGGVSNSGELSLWQVSVHDNNAGNGGGIYSAGVLHMLDVAVFNNISNASGGGLFLDQPGADDFDRVAIYSNQVLGVGDYSGGIHQQGGGSLTLTNTTIYNNTASSGGGMTNTSTSSVHVVNSTIAGNHATSTGGFLNYATADFRNGLLSGNQNGDCYNSGTLTDNSHNLVGDTTCSLDFTAVGDLLGSPVAMNFTAPGWTGSVPVLAPIAGSATIDAGTNIGCPAYDARTVIRPVDSDLSGSAICDIGAYEFRPDSSITVTSDTPDPSRVGVPFTVNVAVSGAGPMPTGLVSVQMGETTCVATLAGGTGSCALTPGMSGVREIDVFHEGDDQYEGSSNFASHVVTQIAKLASSGAYDGWVLESSETSSVGGTLNATAATFNLGDDAANRQYRAILHFNTASLPDTAVVVRATLQIKRQVLVGANPFASFGPLRAYLRKPAFGTAALELSDFQSSPSTPVAASFSATPSLNWYTAILTAAGRAAINRTGTTQFRLRFPLDDNNNHLADYVKFFSGNSVAANQPVLTIEYYVP